MFLWFQRIKNGCNIHENMNRKTMRNCNTRNIDSWWKHKPKSKYFGSQDSTNKRFKIQLRSPPWKWIYLDHVPGSEITSNGSTASQTEKGLNSSNFTSTAPNPSNCTSRAPDLSQFTSNGSLSSHWK